MPFTLTLTVLQRNTFLFPLLLLSFLELDAGEFCIPFGRVKCKPQASWFSELGEVISERRKAFAGAQKVMKIVNLTSLFLGKPCP